MKKKINVTKFESILASTGSAVLQRRAAAINLDATQAQQDLINAIKKEIRKVENQIYNLEDLSIKSTDSLVVGESFNSELWASQMHKCSMELYKLNEQLQIAEANTTKYFTVTEAIKEVTE